MFLRQAQRGVIKETCHAVEVVLHASSERRLSFEGAVRGGGGKCLYVYFRGGKMQSYLEPTLENKLEKIHYFARRQ